MDTRIDSSTPIENLPFTPQMRWHKPLSGINTVREAMDRLRVAQTGNGPILMKLDLSGKNLRWVVAGVPQICGPIIRLFESINIPLRPYKGKFDKDMGPKTEGPNPYTLDTRLSELQMLPVARDAIIKACDRDYTLRDAFRMLEYFPDGWLTIKGERIPEVRPSLARILRDLSVQLGYPMMGTIYARPLTDLELTPETFRVLYEAGLNTVGDILEKVFIQHGRLCDRNTNLPLCSATTGTPIAGARSDNVICDLISRLQAIQSDVGIIVRPGKTLEESANKILERFRHGDGKSRGR